MKKIIILIFGLLLGLSAVDPAQAMIKNPGPGDIDAARVAGVKFRNAVKEAFTKKDPLLIDQSRKEWLANDGTATAFIYTRFSSLVEAFSQSPEMNNYGINSVLKSRENKLGFEVQLDSSFINNISDFNLSMKIGGKTYYPIFQRAEVVNAVRVGEFKGQISAIFNTGDLTGQEKVRLEVVSKSKKTVIYSFSFSLADCR